MTERFPGKHVAIVTDNKDPKNLSRVRVKVPEIFGDEETGWCLPCTPYAGDKVGLAAVPPEGSLVYVEWPAGDTARTPIWSGGLWADGAGVAGAGPDALVLVTPAGHKILLSDEKGKEKVEVIAKSKARITLDKNGATIAFGKAKIELTNQGVSVNGGALKVTL